jgi:hypothetical protein
MSQNVSSSGVPRLTVFFTTCTAQPKGMPRATEQKHPQPIFICGSISDQIADQAIEILAAELAGRLSSFDSKQNQCLRNKSMPHRVAREFGVANAIKLSAREGKKPTPAISRR